VDSLGLVELGACETYAGVIASLWSWPPRFFHDPQCGLKFVNTKCKFQPNGPRILKDRIFLLFDRFETDQNTPTSSLDVCSTRLEIDGAGVAIEPS
jgi:hypothetical protein